MKRLRDEVTKIQAMADVKKKFADVGAEVVIGGPDEYNERVRAQIRCAVELFTSRTKLQARCFGNFP